MLHLEKIRRLSTFMQAATIVGLVGLPLLLVGLWLLSPDTYWAAPELRAVRRTNPEFPLPLRLAAAAITLAAAGPLLFGLDQLRRLFALYRTGQVFVPDGAQRLRAFAWAVILMAIVQPIAGAVLSVVLTLDNPPSERMLSISIGSGQVQTLFVGVLFLVIATIMREATRIADENAQII